MRLEDEKSPKGGSAFRFKLGKPDQELQPHYNHEEFLFF
jgi:hypothetical protein